VELGVLGFGIDVGCPGGVGGQLDAGIDVGGRIGERLKPKSGEPQHGEA
jgi:hypothetical protein